MTDTIEPVELDEDEKQQIAHRLVDQAREQGVDLVGPGGVLTGLTKTVLEIALDGELAEHLGYDKHDPVGRNGGNSRNGSVWSARYTGTLTAPATGTYRFSLQAGAHVTVYIDGQRTVTFKPTFEPTQNRLIHLTAGAHRIRVVVTPYLHQPVTVEAFAVTAGLHLGWQPQENQLVSAAANAARAADVAVVVASAPASEGWDRSTLALPADQNKLIAAVAAANPHTIVVLNTASAVTMPWLSKVAGVVEVWFPGQTAGTAIAQVLFGDVNPSGKLPVTFPASDRRGPAGPEPSTPATAPTSTTAKAP